MNNQVKTTRPQRLLREGMLSSAARLPGKAAVIIEGKSYSYADLLDASSRLAAALKEQGLKRGDRVALFMENTWPCVASIYAVLLAGGVFVVVNSQTKSDKLKYVLNDSDARFLITDSAFADRFLPILPELEDLIGIIHSGDLSSHEKNDKVTLNNFDDILRTTEPLTTPVEVIPNDLAALIYTSGSTGFPKGVMQTHQSMVFAAWSLIEYQRLSETDRILLVLPIAFDYGLYQLLMALKLGATLVIERSFAFPARIYEQIEKLNVTVFPGVPSIYAMMLSSHKKKKLCFPSVTRVTNTAAALPADYVPYLHEMFPNALIYKMYGQTECKRVSYLDPELVDEKPASVGRAIPGTEVFLLSDKGQPVPPGEIGILHVRGPHVMLGYWKKPELSQEMLKPGKLPGERILCTHDLFKMDDDGLLYFVGRTDDIIKTRGEKVSPVEIENVLHAMRGIKDAAVFGVPDEIHGESIRAYVSLEKDSDLNEKRIKKYCLSHLENFMIPKEIVFLDELPKLQNQKIDRVRLKTLQ